MLPVRKQHAGGHGGGLPCCPLPLAELLALGTGKQPRLLPPRPGWGMGPEAAS